MLVIRVPPERPCVRYRAYAERLNDASVLDWIVDRFDTMAPTNNRTIYVCEAQCEPDRLRSACRTSDRAEFLAITATGELDQCDQLMRGLGMRRVMVGGFGHSAAPDALLRELLLIHDLSGSELTSATGATFGGDLYVIEASLAAELLRATLPQMPKDTISAAAMYLEASRSDRRVARSFKWTTIDVGKRYGLERCRWPEMIDFRSRRDVDILRLALTSHQAAMNERYTLIDALKHAAIEVRRQRSKAVERDCLPVSRHDKRIRVLYVSGSAAFSGASQSLCHLIGALDRTRYEPFALVSCSGTFTDELHRRGVTVICPDDHFANNDFESLQFGRRVLSECMPDIVHSNHTTGMGLACAAIADGLPLVQHVRVQRPQDIRELIYAADAVIAVSHFVRDRIAELDVNLGKVSVIWNGVDTDEVKPDSRAPAVCRHELGISSDEFVVTMIARLAPSKRHDILIDAFRRLRQDIGRGHLLLVAPPDDDNVYRTHVHSLLRHDSLARHVTFLEFVPDIRLVLHASDILALPSEDEPLARAVLEAMAVGVPVIVADSGGSKEVVDSGRTGLVIPYGKVEPLADGIRELAQDTERLRSMGAAAAASVRQCLTAMHCAERTGRVYERLLAIKHR